MAGTPYAASGAAAAARELLELLHAAESMPYIGERGAPLLPPHAARSSQLTRPCRWRRNAVSQAEHMLQAACLAERGGCDRDVVLAALLHDIGHICAPPDAPRMDDCGIVGHERVGARFLRQHGLPRRVCELVETHVEAKRYLAYARGDAYLARLSPASRGTLRFQGGPMTEAQAMAFERRPIFTDALRIRAFDEAAKVVPHPADVPKYAHYLQALTEAIADGREAELADRAATSRPTAP